MQIDNSVAVVSVVSGTLMAAQDIPGLAVADRIGIGAIAVMVVWWMLSSFSRRLDKLTEAIALLTDAAATKGERE